jgi:putative intracellular protease/amidase
MCSRPQSAELGQILKAQEQKGGLIAAMCAGWLKAL